MIKSLSRLALEQLSFSVAFSSFTIYLFDDWRRRILFISLYQLDEIFCIDEYLAFMLYLLTSLCFEPIFSLDWSFLDYQITVFLIFFGLTEITRLHGGMFWLIILEDLKLLDCWGCCFIPLPEGKWLFDYLFSLIIQDSSLTMMAMRFDNIKDMLSLGGGRVAVIAFDGRMSNNTSNDIFSIWTKDIIGVFVILELEIKIFYNFVSCLHLFLITLYLNIQLHLHIGQFLDLWEIFHSAWPLFK